MILTRTLYSRGYTFPLFMDWETQESLSHSLKVTQLIMSEATFDPEHSECRAEVCHYQRLFGDWEKCPLYGCLSATVSVPHHSPHLLGQGPKAGESPEGIC